jgi:hypothetical protein
LLGHQFGGAVGDPLDQLVGDVDADRVHRDIC